LLGAFPLYAVSCAKCLQAVWPALPTLPTALAVLTVLFAVNVLGLVVAVALQAVTAGIGGLVLASSLLTFTHTGSNGIIELGGEIKDPGRTIPGRSSSRCPSSSSFYILIAFVAAWARPWTASAGQTLTATAATFLGGGLFPFFVVGGGVLAIITTLNATFMFGAKSLIRMADDGWIPKSLTAISPRFATPHRLLFLIYLFSMGSLLVFGEKALTGFPALASIGAILILSPVMVAALRLKRFAPKE